MQRLAPSLPVLLTLTFTACDLAPGDDSGGEDSATDDGAVDDGATATGSESGGADETGGPGDTGEGTGTVDETGEESSSDTQDAPGVWMEASSPCGGSATNAMWFDDREHGLIGCGENAEGEGLFTTADGGVSWEDHPSFNEVRVMDIRRGPDGVLRGAGIHQLDGYSVFSIDEDGALSPTGLYDPGNNAFTTVNQAENVAVTNDGQILIDSLTGTSAA